MAEEAKGDPPINSKDDPFRGTPLWARRHPLIIAGSCFLVGIAFIVTGVLLTTSGHHGYFDVRYVGTAAAALFVGFVYLYIARRERK